MAKMILISLKVAVLLILAHVVQAQDKQADLVIFSFDRPLQFYALVESIEKYISGIQSIWVIYRVSSPEFDKAYQVCFKRFKGLRINAIKQGEQPNCDFKALTLGLIEKLQEDYLLFAVDDIMVKDYFDLSKCIAYLELYNAYGFYLRLGKNISYCYAGRVESPVPPHVQHNADIIGWKFEEAVGEWRYLHSLDMTLYRRDGIRATFGQLAFSTPNTLEFAWANCGDQAGYGLCYNDSKIVNVPLNTVQCDWPMFNMNYPTQELLDLFNQGYRLNVERYFKLKNSAPHMEVMPYLRRNFIH